MLHIEKEIFERKHNILKIQEWEEKHGVFAGFSTRNGGNSLFPYDSLNLSFTVGDHPQHIINNRKILANQTSIPYEKWVFAAQKHTKNIQEITTEDCGKGTLDFASGVTDVDALYTKEKGIMLATFHADCTPVYLIAPRHNLIGIIHAGWQGTVQEITRHFVEKWISLGVKTKDIFAVIGPGASMASYVVGEDVVKAALKMDLETVREGFVSLGSGKYKMDTGYINFLALVDLGVPDEQIVISSYCTIADDDLFYSFRRDGATGRMVAFISQ